MADTEWSDYTSRICAEIDLDAVRFNMESMHRNLQENVQMTAVVKADGYGHGAVQIAREIEDLPYLWGFAVATFEEAMELRESGIVKPVLILGYVFPYCYEDVARLELRPTVFRRDMIRQLAAAAQKVGKKIHVHVAVDTGMSRIGVTPDAEGADFVREVLSNPMLDAEGTFTHFARADETDLSTALAQFAKYRNFVNTVKERTGYEFPLRHCSNSAGIIALRDCNLDMVRAGITLYGLWPSEEVPKTPVPIKPVMSLHSHVVYVKDLPAGVPVSYGGTYVTDHVTRVATIPVGYADGYPRGLSGKGCVLIRGKRAPILGRVCMDQMMVCVDSIPGVQEGDPVTLIGTDGAETISMEEAGKLSGRFNYEFACNISPRVPRVYIRNGKRSS